MLRRKLPRFVKYRHWIQAVFLPLWLAPISFLRGFPSCVYHCYACPLASFACPIGMLASYSALHAVPWMLLGMFLIVGGLFGSLVCGWACPFGLFQDLMAKIPTPRIRIPHWMSYIRYVVLLAFVILIPYFFGKENNALFICKLCPSGALEATVPASVESAMEGGRIWLASWYKTTILIVILVAMLFTYRPWCTVFCPLGAILGLFNHISVAFLRFNASSCTECNLCRSHCQMNVAHEAGIHHHRCIRCMECTACGAIEPALAQAGAEGKAQESNSESSDTSRNK